MEFERTVSVFGFICLITDITTATKATTELLLFIVDSEVNTYMFYYAIKMKISGNIIQPLLLFVILLKNIKYIFCFLRYFNKTII